MRCFKPSQTFFTPQSIDRVCVPLKMYNVHKNTISNIIFIEWILNELKFFWFSFFLLLAFFCPVPSFVFFLARFVMISFFRVEILEQFLCSFGLHIYSEAWHGEQEAKKKNSFRCFISCSFLRLRFYDGARKQLSGLGRHTRDYFSSASPSPPSSILSSEPSVPFRLPLLPWFDCHPSHRTFWFFRSILLFHFRYMCPPSIHPTVHTWSS